MASLLVDSASKLLKRITISVVIVTISLVRTTVAQAPENAPCWNATNNNHVFFDLSGIISYDKAQVSNIESCRLACQFNFECHSVDWDPAQNANVSCFLFNSSATVYPAVNVSHHSLNRTCSNSINGCWTAAQISTRAINGQYLASADQPWLCQAACLNDLSCTGIDFDNQSRCWLIRGGERQWMEGVTHYDIDRSPGCRQLFTLLPPISGTTPTSSSSSSTVSTTTTTTTTTASFSLPSTVPTGPSPDSEGTSFVLTFPPAKPESINGSQTITICTRSYDDVSVDITSPGNNFSTTINVSLAACQTIPVPSSVRMMTNNSSTWANHVIVTSSNLVSIVLSVYGSCTSYSVLPESSLGYVYYAVVASPSMTTNDAAMIVVTGISMSPTYVTFSWPPSSMMSNILLCDGTSITSITNSQFTLFRGQSLCIQSPNVDFTGTMITGSSPIAVVAGNINYRSNYVIVQMLPMWAWSTTYAISPTLLSTYDVIIVGKSSDVVVNLNNNTNYSSNALGVVRISTLTVQNVAVLRATQPVMVIAYPANAPTAILLPGVGSYQTSYSFTLPELPTSNNESSSYTLVVTSTGEMQNMSLFVTGSDYYAYKSLPNYAEGNIWWSAVGLFPGLSYYVTIIPTGNTSFGAYVIYNNLEDSCAMGFPLSSGQTTPLSATSVSLAAPQAIKPAYIVLAGLGAGNLLLVIIAVVLLCCYPIRDENGFINNGGLSASATDADNGRGSSSKKRGKKSRNSTAHAGDVEMHHTEMASAASATSAHHQNYDDHQMIETNPYYEHGGKHAHEEPNSKHVTDHVTDVYGNQSELDREAKLLEDEKDSHAF